ncbi:MAG: NACHT domain-containing protein, partial [Candidatus Kariarchaeaceae archaeon]
HSAISNYPDLKEYLICVPYDFSTTEETRFEKYKKEWIALALKKNIQLNIILWNKSNLRNELLRIENSEFRIKFWFDQSILSNSWFKQHIEDTVATAGPRYVPELNIKVPINFVYHAFGRTSQWVDQILECIEVLNKLFATWSKLVNNNTADPSVPQFPQTLKENGIDLITKFDKLKIPLKNSISLSIHQTAHFNINDYDDLITATANLIGDLKNDIELKLGQGTADNESFKQWMTEYQLQFPTANYDQCKKIHQYLIDQREKFLIFTIYNAESLLITGEAGSGKTHSICDISNERLRNDQYSIVLFGSQFSIQEPWDQIRSLLGFDLTLSRDDILSTLDLMGSINESIVILFIDALNETENRKFWKTHLTRIVNQVKRYPYLKLCISCRTEYIEDRLPDNLLIPRYEHLGFEGMEYEAVFHFFKFYTIQIPNIPLLSREFTNPLLLKMICETLNHNRYTSFPNDFFGLSNIISAYLQSKESKIADKLDYHIREQHVNNAINKIINEMRSNNSNSLKWDEVKTICDREWSSTQKSTSLFDNMLKEGIIKELVRREENINLIYLIEFGYEKFFDYLLARSYLTDVFSEDLDSVFEQVGQLGFLFKGNEFQDQYQSLLDSLAILIPEKYERELFNIIISSRWSALYRSFVSSLNWREKNSIKNYAKFHFERSFSDKKAFEDAWELMIVLATRENHPLNAYWLHDYLMGFTMSARDEWWGLFLYTQFNLPSSAISRLINWCYRISPKDVNPEVVKLWVITLLWFTTASDRRIRDEASKAVVHLTKDHSAIWPSLLTKFETIDDYYLLERLLLTLYGVILLVPFEKTTAKEIKTWIDLYIASNGIPVNVKIRDSIRLIIQI